MGPLTRIPFLALALAALFLAGCGRPQAPFDQKRWLTADLLTHERADMVESLLTRHRLVGMSRQHIVQLLGRPTETALWGIAISSVLGPGGGFGIDNEWLVLELDGHQRVASYRRTED